MDVFNVSVEQLAIQNWNTLIFIEFSIVLNPVVIVWCLGFWVLVVLESRESVPRRGYPRVS
jgi:hypothetical protein